MQTVRGEGVLEAAKGPALRVVVDGSAWFEIEQLRLVLGEGVVVVTEGAPLHRVRTAAGTECRIVTISPADCYFHGPEPCVLAPRWFEQVLKAGQGEGWNLANALARRAARAGGSCADLEELVAASVHAIAKGQQHLDTYLARCPGRSRMHQRTVFAKLLRVRAAFDLDFYGEFRLADMARYANISKLHFLRLYRDVFGRTPFQEFNDARVARARALLASHPGSVMDIALLLGFRNRAGFSRWVSEHCGAPPTELRRPVTASQGMARLREMEGFATIKPNATKSGRETAA